MTESFAHVEKNILNAFRLVIANYLHRVYYIVGMERMDLETIFADMRPLLFLNFQFFLAIWQFAYRL